MLGGYLVAQAGSTLQSSQKPMDFRIRVWTQTQEKKTSILQWADLQRPDSQNLEVYSPGSPGIHTCDLRQAAIFGFTLPAWKTERNTWFFTERMNACKALSMKTLGALQTTKNKVWDFDTISFQSESQLWGLQWKDIKEMRSGGTTSELHREYEGTFLFKHAKLTCAEVNDHLKKVKQQQFMYIFQQFEKCCLTWTVSLWLCSSSLILSGESYIVTDLSRGSAGGKRAILPAFSMANLPKVSRICSLMLAMSSFGDKLPMH